MSTNTRGACPVLNSLANCGIIDSSGRNLDFKTIKTIANFTKLPIVLFYIIIMYVKMSKIFTFDVENFSLDDISDHGVIEHDNSIARYDYSKENKNRYKTEINLDNIKEYLDLCKPDGYIYKDDILKLKEEKYSKKQNSSFWLDNLIPSSEIEALFTVFGKEGKILKEDFVEIFQNERIPNSFLESNL